MMRPHRAEAQDAAVRRHPKPSGNAEQPVSSEPPAHVFDQTNGVLGDDDEQVDRSGRGTSTTPPSRFGVPPIVSL